MDSNQGVVLEIGRGPAWYRSSVQPVRNAEGKAAMVLFSATEVRFANREMERAMRLKDEFLANMSQERAMRHIDASGRHLLAVINDLLDLSKIEAGRLDLEIEATELQVEPTPAAGGANRSRHAGAVLCPQNAQLDKGMADESGARVTEHGEQSIVGIKDAAVGLAGDRDAAEAGADVCAYLQLCVYDKPAAAWDKWR